MLYNKYNFQICEFTSKNNSPEEIQGIYVEPDRTTATDRFTLISVSTPSDVKINEFPIPPENEKPLDKIEPFILPRKDAKDLIKPLSKKCTLPILENAVILKQRETIVEIGTTDLQVYNRSATKTIEGQYPDYKKVIKETEDNKEYTELSLNAEYLEKIAKFFKGFTSHNHEIKVRIPKDNTIPVRFYAKKENQDATALLMPIKK